MSYTSDPSLVLRKYLSILSPEGEIYLFMDRSARNAPEKAFEAANRSRGSVQLPDGTSQSLMDWLLALDGHGLEVKELLNEARFESGPLVGGARVEHRYHTIRIQRAKTGSISIPDLELQEADASRNPPIRKFRQK